MASTNVSRNVSAAYVVGNGLILVERGVAELSLGHVGLCRRGLLVDPRLKLLAQPLAVEFLSEGGVGFESLGFGFDSSCSPACLKVSVSVSVNTSSIPRNA